MFLGVMQLQQQPCGAAAQNGIDGEFRCTSLTSVGPQIPRVVEKFMCSEGTSVRLPIGVGSGDGITSLCDRASGSSFSPSPVSSILVERVVSGRQVPTPISQKSIDRNTEGVARKADGKERGRWVERAVSGINRSHKKV